MHIPLKFQESLIYVPTQLLGKVNIPHTLVDRVALRRSVGDLETLWIWGGVFAVGKLGATEGSFEEGWMTLDAFDEAELLAVIPSNEEVCAVDACSAVVNVISWRCELGFVAEITDVIQCRQITSSFCPILLRTMIIRNTLITHHSHGLIQLFGQRILIKRRRPMYLKLLDNMLINLLLYQS